ncbi:MAG: DUF6089 family protein [Bacteroidales bacterium]|nr:DUF6089 family protein [Bacteroidales bacterium]
MGYQSFNKILSLLLFFNFHLYFYSQNYYDFGFYAGAVYYQGDINPSKLFYMPDFSYGGFLRYVFHSRWAIRCNMYAGSLNGNDARSKYSYQKIRGHYFSSPIIDITGQLELNFQSYFFGRTEKHFKWTPYVASGFTFLISSWSEQVFVPALPMSLGLKYNFTKKFSMGIEWSYRKTFSDKIDNLWWYEKLTSTKAENFMFIKQRAYFHQRDYYAFFGIFLTYKYQLKENICYEWE